MFARCPHCNASTFDWYEVLKKCRQCGAELTLGDQMPKILPALFLIGGVICLSVAAAAVPVAMREGDDHKQAQGRIEVRKEVVRREFNGPLMKVYEDEKIFVTYSAGGQMHTIPFSADVSEHGKVVTVHYPGNNPADGSPSPPYSSRITLGFFGILGAVLLALGAALKWNTKAAAETKDEPAGVVT